jgi:hypothetical protein
MPDITAGVSSTVSTLSMVSVYGVHGVVVMSERGCFAGISG